MTFSHMWNSPFLRVNPCLATKRFSVPCTVSPLGEPEIRQLSFIEYKLYGYIVMQLFVHLSYQIDL